MFLKELQHKTIALWGTGEQAEEFFQQWDFYRRFWEKVSRQPFPLIQCVWDSDSTKQGKNFHEWKIERPLAAKKSSNIHCIIAVSRYTPIMQQLERYGYKRNKDFKRSQSFIAMLRHAMVDYVKEILMDAASNNVLEISSKDIEKAVHPSATFLNANRLLYHKIETIEINLSTKAVLEDLVLGYVMRTWEKAGYEQDYFLEIRKHFPLSGIVSSIAMIFDKHVDNLCYFIEKNSLLKRYIGKIQTIGIYDSRYSNGGGQRVLSLLLPMYISLGYRVVFMTDNQDDREYPLPEGVVRVVLQHKCLGEMRFRLEEFSHYIKKYHIDIMCFHYLTQDISLFYETFYFKLLGIPVLTEIHVMFLLLIRKRNYMAKQWKYTFRLMDRIVVLSKVNELFWRNLGCNATYIPNPVENGKCFWNRPIAFSKRNGKRILWIGRTEDVGKRLLDAVDIMEDVKSVIPDVKLCIVGEAKNLSRLRQLISKKHLEHAIEFSGYHTDVAPFYEEADVMLMTSEMEGFPMILVESKLHGVPTVMYELPYLELVRDTRGIFAVPQRDKIAAAQALISILSNRDLRHRMSIEAKRSIHKFIAYDIKGAWQKVFDELSNLEDSYVYDSNSDQGIMQELFLKEIWTEEED